MNIFRKHDWVITFITWVLVALSIITIYSITYSAESAIYGAGASNKQFIFAILGLGVYFFMSVIFDYSYLKSAPILSIFYVVIVGLLTAVIVIAQVNRGAARWIPLGFFNLEPSELSKILMIALCSYIFTKRIAGKFVLRDFVIATIAIIPVLALVFVQPDLSTTLSLVAICGSIFLASAPNPGDLFSAIIAGVLSFFSVIFVIGDFFIFEILQMGNFIETFSAYRWIILFLVLALIGVVFIMRKLSWRLILLAIIIGGLFAGGFTYAWENILKDYQKERVYTFINPEEDSLGAGYQVNQSVIATGSGQLWGRGFGRGTQSNLNFLPERHTDFIFASFAEEFGFVGSVFLIILYVILIIRIVYVGLESGDVFGFLICVGVATMILVQFSINIGMNIGVMPVTGITLPLFSYGGSSLLTVLMSIGLVQSVAKSKDLINTEDSLVPKDKYLL